MAVFHEPLLKLSGSDLVVNSETFWFTYLIAQTIRLHRIHLPMFWPRMRAFHRADYAFF